MGEPGYGEAALVVDGDASCRAVVSALLRRLDYVPVEAATGLDALDEAAKGPPALAVLEVQLDGVSGYEVCRQLRDRYDDEILVVFLSGTRVEPIDRAAGLLLGADEYLVKPFDPGELSARIRSLARRRPSGRPAPPNGDVDLDTLTPREREVVALLARGRSQEEIAAELFISAKTVATHIQRVLAKLGVHSRAQAVAAFHLAGAEEDFQPHLLAVVDG